MATEKTGRRGVAWIAGVGASAGLGAAVARRFAKEGLVAAVTGRTPARIEAVAREIREAGGVAHAFAGDVSREEDVLAIAEKVSALGPLEIAVFNAASAVRTPSLEITVAALEEALRTTTVGGFVFGREAVRRLLPQQRGTLVFTGATASLRGRPPFAAFAASKAALRSISQTLAREFGPRGIHVAHVVIDGGIDGERLRSRHVSVTDAEGLLALEDIADVYWHLHAQPRSAWTQELDLRPFKEPF
ncbi:MAG TPA: SDR family NAD(P)-dependent oxidoreductase [Polyangiaceae bacterium]|jgi:NAD(P)-dependent dehydrogenase (short-subunit alcohol dehydrogenase family)|nr:SDR family NAD(P)-dependent oxidoreductase [Polyangiaceae bacterium]